MGFTNPVTWAVGQLVTAALMNQQVRDNLLAIWKGTTPGDMDYYSSSTAKVRLPIGDEGNALVSMGGVPTWSGFPHVCLRLGSATNTTNDSTAIITGYDTVYADTHGFFTSGSKIVIPAGMAGDYLVGCSGYWYNDNNANLRQIGHQKNGGNAQNVSDVSNSTDAHWMNQIYLRTGVAAADEFEMIVLQKSGGALNFAYATFWMVRIGPTGVV